jgi:uncharacterized protein YbjT (DUF2867 family)
MGRTALITGGTGFVGGHLAERLTAAGWRVRALARAGSDTARLRALGAELVTGSLDDADAIASGAGGADTVFHLAAATTAPGCGRDPARAGWCTSAPTQPAGPPTAAARAAWTTRPAR